MWDLSGNHRWKTPGEYLCVGVSRKNFPCWESLCAVPHRGLECHLLKDRRCRGTGYSPGKVLSLP